MPLLLRSRRYMGILVVGIVTALLLSNLVPDPSGRYVWRGGEKPANAPWYVQLHGKLQRLGLYLQDNFGFRASLPLVRIAIRDYAESPENGVIYIGRHGQLFWGGQSAPAQSAGALFREEAVDRFVDLMMTMQHEMAPEGTKLIVALPPNAQSVDIAELPTWQDSLPALTTEYSFLLEQLKARGIAAVDLREVLKAASGPRRYMANDSHWTHLSSVLAFNATMRAAGHPDWQVNVSEVVGPLAPSDGGDLARTLRRHPPLINENQVLRLKEAGIPSQFAFHSPQEARGFRGTALRYAEKGPRVLILGDSYTNVFWQRLFAFTPVAEAGWMHFSRTVLGSCDFDFDDVRRFKPDLLIVARAERMFPCLGGDWPDNLAEPIERRPHRGSAVAAPN